MFRIVGKLLHPIAQLRHMHAQVLRSLHIGHASLLDQAHSLKLELAGKLPSLHDPPPAPSKHLTRCLRNRVQAMEALPGRQRRQEPGSRGALASGAHYPTAGHTGGDLLAWAGGGGSRNWKRPTSDRRADRACQNSRKPNLKFLRNLTEKRVGARSYRTKKAALK